MQVIEGTCEELKGCCFTCQVVQQRLMEVFGVVKLYRKYNVLKSHWKNFTKGGEKKEDGPQYAPNKYAQAELLNIYYKANGAECCRLITESNPTADILD